ncbi:two-component regulator propeller domain-containing protein [Maribellus comscasis]|nr:two-component regulator propeller domain-containing protein [Maribellus comscasis]
MADGLSHSIVYSIGQDKYGFMWIGTGNGLNIYDGVRFKQFFFDADDQHTIPSNYVEDFLFEDDSVLIATGAGLCKMDVQSKKCRRIDLGGYRQVRTIYKDPEPGIYWVGTQTGLIKYNSKTESYQEFNTSNSNISQNIVRAIYKDKDENLWIGTFDKLNKLPKGSAVFTTIDMKLDYRPSIKNNLTMSLLPFDENNDSLLWIGTQTGLVLYNRFTNEKKFFREENSNLTNSATKDILKSRDGQLWMGTDFGLGEMNPDFDIKIHVHDPFNSNSLTNSIVWDIFEDNSGALWFGTNNGLSILSKTNNRFRFYPMSFTRENNIAGYEIRSVVEDSGENLLLGTQYGFVTFHPKKGIVQAFNSEQPEPRKLSINGAKCLLKDKKGRIWMGTNGGINIWDPYHKKMEKYTADFNSLSGLRTNYITQFFELKDGTILVNTFAGLHKAEEVNGTFNFRFLVDMGLNLYKGEDNLYSCRGTVLYKIDLQTFEGTSEIDFQLANENSRIYTIFSADNKTIWLGLKNGIIKYNISTKEYSCFEIKSNQNYPLINILADEQGTIWASSYSAIIKFTPETGSFEIYPSGNEIPINRFIENCNLKCENGDLIFGGHDGFIRLNPKDIKKIDTVFPVVLTELQVSNQKIIPGQLYNDKRILGKDISFTHQLELNYSDRSFSLEFTTLQFDERDGIRYAYKLENADPDWNYINGAAGNAIYSNLRPGAYKFRLRGTNNHGVWNKAETTLDIRIKAPLWASPLFITLYIILIIGVTWTIIYYYTNRLKMKGELKLIRVEKEYTDNLTKARQQFFTNIAHEFKTPLSLIIGPVEKLLKNKNLDAGGKKYANLIENNARRLLWLNNQLIDFRLLENKTLKMRISRFDIVEFTRNVYLLFTDKAERKNIEFLFHSEFDHLEVYMDLRKIETILFNLFSNAFKFTPENGKIDVSITGGETASEQKFRILVSDSGIGISSEDQQKVFNRFYQANDALKMNRGSGIGLTLVMEYVKMHGGEVDLKSEPGSGSQFSICLPVNNNYREEGLISEKQGLDTILKLPKEEALDESLEANYFANGKPNILLVEDDTEIVDFIKASLREKYNVEVALNGKEALQMVMLREPDLVISDIVMPVMDGIEFTKKFKNNPKTLHIPLILLTGQSEAEKQLEGLKSGADAYITKPFDIELLEVRIENFLKRKEQLKAYLRLDEIVTPQKVSIASQDEKVLEKIVNCIENNISDSDFNIAKLSQQTGISSNALYRKIKNLTGQTTNEFIRTVRIRRAEQLLRTKKFTVSEVMDQTGFSNRSYFSKCFRKLYGMAPREYIDRV